MLNFNFPLVRFVTIKIIKKYLNIDLRTFFKNKSSKMISRVYNEGSSFIDWYISPLIVIISEVIFVASISIIIIC